MSNVVKTPEPALAYSNPELPLRTPKERTAARLAMLDRAADHDGVSAAAFKLLYRISAKIADSDHGFAYTGQRWLSGRERLGERQVRRLLGELVKASCLTSKRRGYGKNNIYWLGFVPLEVPKAKGGERPKMSAPDRSKMSDHKTPPSQPPLSLEPGPALEGHPCEAESLSARAESAEEAQSQEAKIAEPRPAAPKMLIEDRAEGESQSPDLRGRQARGSGSELDPAITVKVDWRELREAMASITMQRTLKTAELAWRFAGPGIEAARAANFARAQQFVSPALAHLQQLRRAAG